MTHQDEECAMKKHVNMLPVDNLFEISEEMGKSKDFVINGHEAFGKKYSNMFDSEPESDAASSVPTSEGKNSTERREECGSQIAESKEANIRPLQSGKKSLQCIGNWYKSGEWVLLMLLLGVFSKQFTFYHLIN